ncbi:hypothetical protein B0I35DRAFT_446885 [Stachybotrys elegans]|uniref:Uncharacterized protein n=1 Tax=Stachybotrys elegans TaxID=80388 RepID=A0A8K0SD52_9HYPO|nr:hypothetical protein B0I35DRAFT_446885 [Stachybotrys elegans]
MRRAPNRIFSVILVATALFASAQAASVWKSDAVTWQFRSWYPQYSRVFSSVLRDSCQEPYAAYQRGWVDNDKIDVLGGGDEHSALIQPVILCLLDNTSEYIKSAMSSAQVLLGVTPTILAYMGPTAQELSLLSVVAKRPFLSFCLSLGSPGMHLTRAFQYNDPAKLFEDQAGSFQPVVRGNRIRFIAAGQYLAAFIALANIGHLYYELSVQTVSAIWPDNFIGPLLWGAFAAAFHFSSLWLLMLRMRRAEYSLREGEVRRQRASILSRIRAWWRLEWQVSAHQNKIYIVVYPESTQFVVLWWVVSICMVGHLVYGTILLSSMFFIGPRDALVIIARFMISALMSRLIIAYEVAGLRMNYTELVVKYTRAEPRVVYDV